jgi:hypothetical protein
MSVHPAHKQAGLCPSRHDTCNGCHHAAAAAIAAQNYELRALKHVRSRACATRAFSLSHTHTHTHHAHMRMSHFSQPSEASFCYGET